MAFVTADVDHDPGTLLASAAAGDEEAFSRIVASHHEDMRRVCVVVTGDPRVADDAVQAAWAIAWRRLGSVRDPGRLRPWLVSVAVNEARQLVRSQRRRSLHEMTPADPSERAATDPAAGISGIDMRDALARLDPRDRALLAMRYVAGFDATELAAATGLSPSGTRARLARLLARLSKELGDG
jgi:RNA polymerase sigma factor (sigma-70 family)